MAGGRRAGLPRPEPPLGDGEVRLRPWGEGGDGDALALAAAWNDPAVRRWSAGPPPERRNPTYAARWIDGESDRRRRGLALDLVIAPADPPADTSVLGEVGLGPIDWRTMTAHIGWWVAGPARGKGVAARAVALLARWAERELALRVVAEVDPGNLASLRVAERAGVEVVNRTS
ncbi:MAG: GNAT family N-acetyltransferase [Acidimicrobiales bacterium]